MTAARAVMTAARGGQTGPTRATCCDIVTDEIEALFLGSLQRWRSDKNATRLRHRLLKLLLFLDE